MCNQLYPKRQPYNILLASSSNCKEEMAIVGLWSMDKTKTVNANGKKKGLKQTTEFF